MAIQLAIGRGLRWAMLGLAFGVGAFISAVAAIPHWLGINIWQTLAHLRAIDAVLMMGGIDHTYLPFLIVGGIGILTLLTLAMLTPLALGFFVLDIHLELQQVCDTQGKPHTERRLFCKLQRPTKAKNDDAPTRFLSPQAH